MASAPRPGSTIRRILAGYSNGCWKRWPTPRATAPNTATRPTTTPRQAVPTDISRKSATATIFRSASRPGYAYELVFDYGEYALDGLSRPGADPYAPARAWTERPDPFSSFRSGFEIRTRRLCRGVLTFLNFPTELGALPCLNASVRSATPNRPTCPACPRCCPPATAGWPTAPTRNCRCRRCAGASARSTAARAALRAAAGAGRDRPARLPGARRLPARGLQGAGLPGFLQSDGVVTRYYEPLGDGRYARRWRRRAFPTAATWPIPRWPWSTWTAMASWSCWYRPAAPRASTGMATMAAGAAASRSTPSPPCTAPARPRRWT